MAFPKKIPEGVRVTLLTLLATGLLLWVFLGRQFCYSVIGGVRPGAVFMLQDQHGGGRTRVTVIKHDWPYGDVVYQLPNGQILASRTDFFYSLTK